LPCEKSDGSEEALNITGEDVSEGHVNTESRLLNAYGSPAVVRGQNENRVAARREEDVSESRSVVNRVGLKPQLFVHIEVYASVCWFFSISISN